MVSAVGIKVDFVKVFLVLCVLCIDIQAFLEEAPQSSEYLYAWYSDPNFLKNFVNKFYNKYIKWEWFSFSIEENVTNITYIYIIDRPLDKCKKAEEFNIKISR